MQKINYLFFTLLCLPLQIVGQNVIEYTTIDGTKLSTAQVSQIDGTLVSHTYKAGKGKITFTPRKGNSITTIGVSAFKETDAKMYFDPKDGETITIIGSSAFPETDRDYEHKLKTIRIPEGVTTLDKYSLADCSYLEKVELPQSLSTFDVGVFQHDTLLQSLNIPFPSQCVPNYTFKDCWSLSSIDISNAKESIGKQAFARCKNLNKITIPKAVRLIKDSAFYYCGATEVILPAEMDSIAPNAFRGVPVTTLNLPKGLRTLSFFCYGFTRVKHVTVPNTVTDMAISCFECCYELESIDIPTSVKHIGTTVFANCSSFTTINYGGTKSQWEEIKKDKSWYYGTWRSTPLSVIHCTDGDIEMEPWIKKETAIRGNYFLHIDETHWATLCLPFAECQSPNNLSYYVVNGVNANGTLAIKSQKRLLQSTPALINGPSGYYLFTGKIYASKKETSSTKGLLTGTYEDFELSGDNNYVLQNQDGKIGFYRVNSAHTVKVPAFKAFLHYQCPNQGNERIWIEDSSNTKLENIKTKTSQSNKVYDIFGFPIDSSQHAGFRISNNNCLIITR